MSVPECVDSFYGEFFSQREAFDAVDAENARRKQYGAPILIPCVDGLPGGLSPSAIKRLRRMDGLFHMELKTTWERSSPTPEQHCVRPWCWERPRPSQTPVRKYIAASCERMWHEMQLQPGQRHVYEIIRQDTPCNLYFDLEYQTANNLGRSGNEMIEILLRIVDSITRCAANCIPSRATVPASIRHNLFCCM